MSKLYYDDPLQAIWMQQRFNVEIIGYASQYIVDEDGADYKGQIISWKDMCNMEGFPDFYTYGDLISYIDTELPHGYIHPDSYKIFEPHNDDIINNGTIIKRNGKHFFMPKKETK